ncbi:hypothetical protein [Pseudomonas sp. RIT-PI-AD]|uniref:hypothetical protein n=1 Tax=Pseudomonas sp. RIT-PI-AD TaxID=3035294 RepID=UPI0021DB32B4|nr:hypothetical protein [Pseudomonas sp. RIT-PI-AD]
MSLADERRAIDTRIRGERQAIDPRMRGERQASADELAENLNRLVNPPRQNQPLRPLDPRGKLAAQTGKGTWNKPATNTGTGGVASPLTEVPNTREYYDPISNLYSNDYFLSVELRPVKAMHMVDANNAPVVMQFAVPARPTQ